MTAGSATPRECLRLMGWNDEQIDKIAAAKVSATQQYSAQSLSSGICVSHLFRVRPYGKSQRTISTDLGSSLDIISKQSPWYNLILPPKIKIAAAKVSATQQYRQAGNGIVVQVLEFIFKALFLGEV